MPSSANALVLSPYGRQRPDAVRTSPPSSAKSWRTRRDLPMPGWPTRIATRALLDVVAASTAARSRSRSASRLTNGAPPSGRGAGAASGAPTSR